MRPFAGFFVVVLAASAHAQSDAQRLLQQAMDAMGGRERLLTIRQVTTQGLGHSYLVEQSDRYEGPYLVSYLDTEQSVDFPAATVGNKGKTRGALFEQWREFDGSWRFEPGKAPARTGRGIVSANDSKFRYVFGPERVLFLAESGGDLKLLKPAILQQTRQDVVAFKWGAQPVTLYLNAHTHLPTAVDVLAPGDGFWSVFGDVTSRLLYSNWSLQPGGLRYPLLWNFEKNGKPVDERTITKVDVVFGDADSSFARWQKAYEPNAETPAPPIFPFKEVDVAPGIVQYTGGFNSTVIDQGDGLVFIEGVSSSPYMTTVIEAAQKRFPGKPIKAVITTTDAWPHIGGLREFAARKVPIIALKENEKIIRDVLNSPRTFLPDSWARKPGKATLRLVTDKVELGSGNNRLTIYPIRGEGAERMLMVYMPANRLLYGSDLIQPMPDGSLFFTEYPDELRMAVEREKLSVDTVFAMHATPRPWSGILEAIERAKAPKPSGND